MLNMYLLPWRNAIHRTDFSRHSHRIYETVLLAGRDVVFNLSPRRWRFLLVLKNKSLMITRDDLEIIGGLFSF